MCFIFLNVNDFILYLCFLTFAEVAFHVSHFIMFIAMHQNITFKESSLYVKTVILRLAEIVVAV